MSKGAAKELKRIIAAGPTATSEGVAAIDTLRDTFTRMQELSRSDQDVLTMIQERLLQQRQDLSQRQHTTKTLVDRLRQVEEVAHADRERVLALEATNSDQQDDLRKVRSEKTALASLNAGLRQEVGLRSEAYAAAVARNQCLQKEASTRDAQLELLRQELKERQSTSDSLRADVRQLDQDRRHANEDLRSARSMIVQLEHDRCQREEQIASLEQRTCVDLRQAHEQLSRENIALTDQISQLHVEVELVRSRVEGGEISLNQAWSTCTMHEANSFQLYTHRCEQDQVVNESLHQKNCIWEKVVQQMAADGERQKRCIRSQLEDAWCQLRERDAVLDQVMTEQMKARAALRAEQDRTMARLTQAEDNSAALQEQRALHRQAVEEVSRLGAINTRLNAELKSLHTQLASAETLLERQGDQLRSLNDTTERERRANHDRISLLAATEAEVRRAVVKLFNAQEAMEGSFTCLVCMRLLHDALICVPCGHVLCGDCHQDRTCTECHRSSTMTIPNPNLDALSGKFTYVRLVLSKLRDDLNSSPIFVEQQ